MFLSYITLAVALSLSVIAAYYSIAGLTAIFAAAVIPIMVMGGILEVGKVVVTLWLHEYWRQCRFLMKVYLVPAVAVLMLITSMGIFGFLSKAHSDQSLVSGDVQAKISLYDEKIRIERENIADAQAVIKQMDAAVNGVIATGDQEIKLRNGTTQVKSAAERSLQIRRSQSKDRAALSKQIDEAQGKIVKLQEEAAPIRAEVRKVEAEVGPIKYIAAMVYGENTGANSLEAAVRWVIILLVIVFDPLAIMMLLAATESLKWEKQRLFDLLNLPKPGPELDHDHVNHMLAAAAVVPDIPTISDEHDATVINQPEPAAEKSLLEQHPYLTTGFAHFKDLVPMVYKPNSTTDNVAIEHEDDELDNEHPSIKAAMIRWKEEHPGSTLKEQRARLARGEITELPWMALVVESESGFGSIMPLTGKKGDTWVLTNVLPNKVYKHNGTKWISVDKSHTANYTYNEAYLDHLIAKIDSGEYDIDLLSANEQEQIAQQLLKKAT